VRGGEGATKLVSVHVTGAKEWAHAERAARTIANSLLVKTAVHGGDPNWGGLSPRPGRSGVPFELGRAAVRIGGIVLFHEGQPHDENAPKRLPTCPAATVEIEVDLGTGGTEQATIWTCDLSAEYVRINADLPDIAEGSDPLFSYFVNTSGGSAQAYERRKKRV
jgi:glutamate N-acetyltransferase/amino-acid N-acetyltransferase